MSIYFAEINPENWRLFYRLKVKENQKTFVPANVGIMARAFAYRGENSKVYGIYAGDEPIGLLMQHDYMKNDKLSCVLTEFMIDEKHQGKGHGEEALRLWVALIKDENKYDSIILCYIEGDEVARNLYLKVGFKHTGEVDEDEVIMEYRLIERVQILERSGQIMFEIRSLNNDDISEVVELKSLCWPEELAGLSDNKIHIKDEVEFWTKWVSEADKWSDVRAIYGVYEKNQMCGAAIGSFIESKEKPEMGMELNGLWIYPKYRSKGISLILMEKLIKQFKSLGCSSMVVYSLHNAPSNKFYRNLGFKVVDTQYQMKEKLPVDIFSIDLKELNKIIDLKLKKYNGYI